MVPIAGGEETSCVSGDSTGRAVGRAIVFGSRGKGRVCRLKEWVMFLEITEIDILTSCDSKMQILISHSTFFLHFMNF